MRHQLYIYYTLFLQISHSWRSLWHPFGFDRTPCGTIGLLFEFLFVNLGRYWGPLDNKMRKLPTHGGHKGVMFGSFVGSRALEIMLCFASFSFTGFEAIWVTFGRQMLLTCSK